MQPQTRFDGKFIVLEGGEGSGKSTAAMALEQFLREKTHAEIVVTREPGGTQLAEAIRSIALADWNENMPALCETLLMFAARNAHWVNKIQPALTAGHTVICDRFVDSSYAYQSKGRGVDEAVLNALVSWTIDDYTPDLVLLFDVPPEVGLARAKGRGDANRFEHEDMEFQNSIREAFLQRARNNAEYTRVVDAGQCIETVNSRVQSFCRELIIDSVDEQDSQ